MGLENDKTVQQIQGTRRRVCWRAVAPSRNLKSGHVWLGRGHQVLGLRGELKF